MKNKLYWMIHKHDISLIELSRKTGISASKLSMYRAGNVRMSVDVVLRLCAFFECDVEDIWPNTEPAERPMA